MVASQMDGSHSCGEKKRGRHVVHATKCTPKNDTDAKLHVCFTTAKKQ